MFLHKRNLSKPNPYSEVLVNEFIIRLKTIDNVFNYTAYSYGGETDMKCYADMISEEKELKMLSTKQNGFYDFKLETSAQEIKFREADNDDCKERKGTILKTYEIYKYNGKRYERSKN